MVRRRSARGVAPARERLAKAWLGYRGPRAPSRTTLLLTLLLPRVASAGWGEENWGEMIWGGSVTPVPSMSIEGLVALATALVVVPGLLLARRRAKGAP